MVQRVDDRDRVAWVDSDDLTQAPLMTLTGLSDRHQHPELMRGEPMLSEHPRPQAPRLRTQTRQQVATAEPQFREPGRVGCRPGV